VKQGVRSVRARLLSIDASAAPPVNFEDVNRDCGEIVHVPAPLERCDAGGIAHARQGGDVLDAAFLSSPQCDGIVEARSVELGRLDALTPELNHRQILELGDAEHAATIDEDPLRAARQDQPKVVSVPLDLKRDGIDPRLVNANVRIAACADHDGAVVTR
jgi:hypothetical protein